MSAGKCFFHDVKSELKPWTHENFGGGSESEDFNFIVFGDGSEPEMVKEAFAKINLLNPDFVISVGYHAPAEFAGEAAKCESPFFQAAGGDLPDSYAFVFKNVLFMSMKTDGDITSDQLAWAEKTLAQNVDVRWTLIFMPNAAVWVNGKNFAALENMLYERNYSVFSGAVGHYTRYRRYGRNYYLVGTSGMTRRPDGQTLRGVPFGEFPQLVRVNFQNGEPVVNVINMTGMYYDDIVTLPKLLWLVPKYFHADRPITPEHAGELEARGLKIYRENGGRGF